MRSLHHFTTANDGLHSLQQSVIPTIPATSFDYPLHPQKPGLFIWYTHCARSNSEEVVREEEYGVCDHS